MAEATKAFPFLNYVPDHIGKRKKAEAYGSEEEPAGRARGGAPKKGQGPRTSGRRARLATSMASSRATGEARRLVHEACARRSSPPTGAGPWI